MKKCIALLTALAAGFSLLIPVWAEAPGLQPPPEMPQSGPMPDFAPDGRRGNWDSAGFDPRISESTSPAAASLPAIDADKLFSSRDLDGSPDLSEAVVIPVKDNSDYTIRSAGIYVLTGEASDFTVRVEADHDADKVQLVLNGASVTNSDFPVIYVSSADKCFVTSLGSNSLSVSNSFTSDGQTGTDAVIFSKDDLTLNGTGTLSILSAAGNGITSKDDLRITGGKYEILSAGHGLEAHDSVSVYDGEFTITANKDAVHCENDARSGAIYIRKGAFTISAADDGIRADAYLVIDGGEFQITAAEGLEATYVQINDGTIRISAGDDGINASRKSDAYDVVIEINGGEITIVMGPGDTDGLDANGVIIVNGGTIDVTGSSAFDADWGCTYNGGTVIINGAAVDSIPVSAMNGRGGERGNPHPGGFGGRAFPGR